MKDENQVFVSYGHVEEEMCKDICAYLSENGFKPWVDTSKLQHGMLWRDEIRKGIEDSGQVVALLSAYSTRDRGVCLDEISIAVGVTGGNIHTILLQEENIINVPPTIGFEQWFDMSDWKKKKAEGDQAYNEWFKAKMDDVIRRLRDPEHVEKYGQITELRKKLNVQYAVGRQQKLLNEHYTGRKWLGEKIDAWLEDPNAPRRCLVTGAPGVGKSAFAVHYAHYNPKTAAALFFSADMPNYNDPCVVIQTLAYLLACRLSAYRKSLLWELDREDRAALAKLTEKELFDKLITKPLSQAINGNHPAMCIILDGLEECGDPQKNTLAKTIAKYADSLPWWLHVLIVARDVPAVKNYTKNALRIELCGEDKNNLEDIRAYYTEALEEKFGNDPAWPETLEQITARSQGIFLYAKMLTSLLLDKGTLDVGGDYPEGLSEVFTLWFDWFFPDGEDYARRWRLPIGCVLGSPEPIPAQTLRRVFDWSENELADFEARLSILLRKGKNVFGDETLVFDHDFVKEWLISGAGENFYFSSPEDGRKKMANALYAVFEEDAEELTYWEAVNLLDLPLTKKQQKKMGEEVDYLLQIEKAANYCDSWGKETAAKEIYEKGIETAQSSHKNKNWEKSFFIHLIDLNVRMGYSTKINTMLKNSISCDEGEIVPGEKASVYNIIMLTRKYLLEGDICKSNGDYEDAFNWYGKGLVNMQDALRVIDSDFAYGHYCLCMERLGSIQEVYEQYEEAARTYITAAMVRLDLWKRDKCSDNTSNLVVGVLGAIRNLSMCQDGDFTQDYIEIFNGIVFQAEKSIKDRGTPQDKRCLASCLNNQAKIFQKEGDYEKAEAALEKSLFLQKKIVENSCLLEDKGRYVVTLIYLGEIYRKRGKEQEEIICIEEALPIYEDIIQKSENSMGNILFEEFLKSISENEEYYNDNSYLEILRKVVEATVKIEKEHGYEEYKKYISAMGKRIDKMTMEIEI